MSSLLNALPDDTPQRDAAIDPHRSFIVQAPAGAGKTELLTQRFLALLAQVDEPEEIIALTFTNKAAAEMRRRIVGSLLEAARGKQADQPHRQKTLDLSHAVLKRNEARGWDLLQHAGRLQVTTLDALCGRLARQMPLLSKLGSQPAVATDPLRLYEEAATRTLQLLESDHPVAMGLAAVLGHFDNDSGSVQRLLAEMLARREQWLRHVEAGNPKLDAERLQEAFERLIEADLRACAQVMHSMLQQPLMAPARFMAAQAVLGQKPLAAQLACLEHWTEPLQGESHELPLWRGLVELLLQSSKDEWRSKAPPGLGLTKTQQPQLVAQWEQALDSLATAIPADVLARIRHLPDVQAAGWEDDLLGHLTAVLQAASEQLWLLFRERGEVDFTQIAQQALQALGTEEQPTDLLLQLDHRISHLLVDEFQDTSPTQLDLLKRLMAGWEWDDPQRSLFLVGDPMQSIYRFRKADVSLFLRVRHQERLGHWPLQFLALNRNNRSVPALVDWVNRSMGRIFPARDDLPRSAVSFAPAKPRREPTVHDGIHWYAAINGLSGADDESDNAALREAAQIVAVIRHTQAQRPSGSIAVLVRARTHLQALLDTLRDSAPELAFQAVEIEPLAERQAIQDLVSLTRLLLHPADRLHGLAVLRAPWCGLLLADLHALAADRQQADVIELLNDDERLARLSADGQARARHVRDVLNEAFAHQGRMRTRRWIEGVWQSLGGPACLAREADLLDVRAYLDLIDRLDAADGIDLDQLDREVQTLYAAPDPSPLARSVQLMTIHKSKGLEFDTVILPGLHRQPAGTDQPLVLWDELPDEQGEEQLLAAVRPAGAVAEDAVASRYTFLQRYEMARARHEAQRLLYVAVTRARDCLHLFGTLGLTSTGELGKPRSGSLLQILWPVAEPEFLRVLQAAVDGDASQVAPTQASRPSPSRVHRLVRLKQPMRHAALLPAEAGTALSFQPERPAGPAAHRRAADIGILVHRYLELIAQDGLDAWSAERVTDLLPAMQRWLQAQGHAPLEAAEAARQVLQSLITTLASAEGRWALQARPQAASEWALMDSREGRARQHVIDRSFSEDGIRWIIDYKTTREDITPERQAAWREQLARYRQLFPDETVRLGVLLTWRGELLRMD